MTAELRLEPLSDSVLHEAAEFLHTSLDDRLTTQEWAAAMRPSWDVEETTHGFLLRDGDRVVGAYLAFHSTRSVSGSTVRVCNLAAWCVLDEHRSSGLRLIRAMLGQRDITFTDLSPSGNVVGLNDRLGFVRLDVSGGLVLNLRLRPRARARVLESRTEIEAALGGDELQIYRDHVGAAAARQLVLVVEGRPCLVVYRRVRRKRLPIFAAILYVSDPAVFRRGSALVYGRLLRRGFPLSLAETRIAGARPWHSVPLRSAGVKMFRSATLEALDIDYLYSELTNVPW